MTGLPPAITYRYGLTRSGSVIWAAKPPNAYRLLWIMLNPSTADERVDDATIRKCLAFTQHGGFADLEVANLFAMRATKPKDLFATIKAQGEDIAIGADNDQHIVSALGRAHAVCCAWGASEHSAVQRRALVVLALIADRIAPERILCIGRCRSKAPRHPLMAPYACKFQPFIREGNYAY